VAGTQIGSYLIERTLGTGGFGVVYVGIDVRLRRRAAIKQLLPEFSENREIVERFFNEAKATASINHPGIVEIYDVGWHTDGSAYFAMKLLDGESLGRRLKSAGPLPVQLAATIARQVASALAAAHARGIVHRDLKPDNIMLVPDDEVVIGERAVVLDFGVAKLAGDRPASQKTRSGMMMGTPSYMSPEQCRGAGEVDHRTDVYALGCILFQMLTGRPPFVGEGIGELLGKHQFIEPPMVCDLRDDVPPDVEALVMRTLAKPLEERFQQMSELVAALQPFAAGGRSGDRPAPYSAPPPIPATPLLPRDEVLGLVNAVPALVAAAEASKPSTLSAGRGEQQASERTPTLGSGPRRLLLFGVMALVVIGAGAGTAIVLSRRPAEEPAATPDAATPDAATPDAATPDAATPDASVDHR
jgi:serine/threonine-protein kinase